MSAFRPFQRSRGVTLVELMVAMVLGLIVAGGIVTVFMSTSSSNRAQTQLARLQEEGRYAVTRIADDLKMAGAQYCSSTGGLAQVAAASGLALDALRTPRVLAKNLTFPQNTTPWGAPYPVTPTAPYNLPSFFYMRGFECTKTACTPSSPPVAADGVPVMGDQVGNRVKGAAVLQLRYIDAGRGWAIGGASTIVSANGLISSIHIVPKAGEPSLSDVVNNEMMMLADCSTAQIFQTTGNPDFVPVGTAGNFSAPRALVPQSAPRFFRLKTDFRTITYFLQVVSDDGTATGAKTGALMRCDSGQTPACQELVRGAERLDFTYGIEDSGGLMRYLTATQVDSRAGNTIPCPAGPPDATSADQGCLWRALKTVEVNILMDGQQPLYTLQTPELAYAYTPEGIPTPQAPTARGTNGVAPSDQGFADQMLRRQFGTVVMMRNYNP
ncbi:type IV pilus assembly protein PilW [Luteibacter sp. W1I16]|uniref:PilW family protein n=1 Tax=Luteibacter sp. W1I16 TaxID=3373922 RepID=UPI003D209127